jgi:hypothetical protein
MAPLTHNILGFLSSLYLDRDHPLAGPRRGRERRDSFTGPGLEKWARESQKQKKNRIIQRNSLILGPKFASF